MKEQTKRKDERHDEGDYKNPAPPHKEAFRLIIRQKISIKSTIKISNSIRDDKTSKTKNRRKARKMKRNNNIIIMLIKLIEKQKH